MTKGIPRSWKIIENRGKFSCD